MSHSIKFLVTPLPVSDETLFDRIKEAASLSNRPNQQTTNSNVPANLDSNPLQLASQSSSSSSTTPINSNINTTSTTTTSSFLSSSSPTTTTAATTPTSTQPSTFATQAAVVAAAAAAVAAAAAAANLQLAPTQMGTGAGATTQIAGTQPTATIETRQSAYNNAINFANVHHNQAQQNHTTLSAIKSVPVSQITIGPRHVALLLEDGRVCRAPYQVLAERLELSSTPQAISSSSAHQLSTLSSSASNSTIAGPSTHPHASQPHHHHIHPHHQQQPSSVANIAKPPLDGSRIVGAPAGIGSVISPTIIPAGLESRAPNVASMGAHQVPVSNMPPFAGRVNITPQVSGLSVQNRQVARRGRMIRQTATRGRGATSVIMGSRTVMAAQYVPEDLINQAQVVLQGKPRSAIVRELQRTNLDVNSAVNNLLSSDNEDPEDMDESQDYLPNEDLMSLLDSSVNLPNGPTSVLIDAETVFPGDVFNSYSASRIRPTTIRHSVGSGRSNSDRESSLASELEIRRMASRDPSQSRRWLEHALRDPSGSDSPLRMNPAAPTDFTLHHKNDPNHYSSGCGSSAGTTKKSTSNNSSPELCPIQISENLELWSAGDKKFVHIASMHSELIAISNTGQIHQWKWSEPMPYESKGPGDVMNYHPKAAQLNLTHEKVKLLSASCVRATVVTESSRVATWVDESIATVASKLEHVAQHFPEFHRGDAISQLDTCSLYSCIRLESGSLFWWGVAPFSQRKKNWKRIQSKSSKHGATNSGGASSSGASGEIGVGSIVCLKNGPSFGDGAIGFTTKDGVPKIIRPADSRRSSQLPASHTVIEPVKTNPSVRSRKMIQPIDFSGNISDDQSLGVSGIVKTSSSERLEMPPPPSPASSTCSEPGCSPSHKRKHKHLISFKEEDRWRDEEQWNLKDVIFLEEVKKPPAAKVIKLDGNTALVRFNQRDPFGNQTDSDVNAYLQDCRMIRKDELQLAKETTSSSRIIDCQRSPKKLNLADSRNFLTFAVSNIGIHALVMNGTNVEYKIYQLASGKVSKSLYFPTDTNALLGRDPSLISLHACGESDVIVTLRDGNGSLYPLEKDYLDSLREPQPLDMAPVQALGMAVHPLRDPSSPNKIHPTIVMAMALENQILIPAVLRSDPEFVRLTLASLEREPVSQQIVAFEKIDLNRNVLHAAVNSCAPKPSRGGGCSDKNKVADDLFDQSYQSNFPTRVIFSDPVKRSRVKPGAPNNVPNTSTSTTLDLSSNGDSRPSSFQETESNQSLDDSSDWPSAISCKFEVDPNEQNQPAHVVLSILIESSVLRPYLKDLMTQRDAHGMTPFMSAVSSRAYTAAIMLFDLAQRIVLQENADQTQKQKLSNSMIFPSGTNLDNNPLIMLCANDTCSFTWTGAQHINQDIFECKTCGLTRTLCCCSECARTCHKGHDCRLKKTSPTAYCDCWEKCKCKSLVTGSQMTRFKMLERLIAETDLVSYPDTKRESILLFLVQTVGRQMIEQKQYGPDRSFRHKRDEPADMPDHDLSPPRFARKALHRLLSEWLALKTVITAGAGSAQNLSNAARVNTYLNAEDKMFLSVQQGTALLDRFTHSLLVKIGPEMLDVLLTTIIRESSSIIPGRQNEARLVAKRFVRSVARNGVVLSVELSPINYSHAMNTLDLSNILNHPAYGPSSTPGGPWKNSQQPASILQKCRKVFQALLPIAAEELAEIADALISPVRLGVPRPTAPFSLVNSMAEATQGSEEIFVVEPVVLPFSSSNVAEPTFSGRQPEQSGTNQPQLAQSGTNSAVASQSQPIAADRIRDMLFENEMVIEAIDSEDADASNNTFRPSNNGESDSDSDSNPDDASIQSNVDPSGARSIATAATAGSELGASTVAYFSEAESGDSSNGEEDDEESEANDTEQDNDDLTFSPDDGFPFSRRQAIHQSGSTDHGQQQSARSTNLGQQLHWALRHRDHSFYPAQPNPSYASTANRLASMGLANNYPPLDGVTARRSGISNPGQSSSNNLNHELSMSTTAVGLSRAFSIIIRSISDLIPILKESEKFNSALTINQLRVTPTEAAAIITNLEKKMNPVWEWLFKVMDSTEGQLRFGCALTNGIQAASQTLNPLHSHHYRSSGLQAVLNNSAPLASASIFPPQVGSNLLPVHPTMLARVNANLTAQGLTRRVPNLFDEAATRIHNSSSTSTSIPISQASGTDPGVRLHNPISGGSVPGRPQSLTTRSNQPMPNYGSRMPLNETSDSSDASAARRDFLSYMISLIRGHGNEHHDSLPILDVSSLRHVAYVFDAYIYYLQALNRDKLPKQAENMDDEEISASLDGQDNRGRKHPFFRRSESTLFLNGAAPDPFTLPISEALPLAEQPHLLQPNFRREDLFGITKTTATDVDVDSLPLRMSLSASSSANCQKCLTRSKQSLEQDSSAMKTDDELRHTALLSRWKLTVELFGREFLDDVGAEPGSILTDLVGFPLKENRFRKEMERLRIESAPREISLINVDRDRNTLIRQTIKELNNNYHLSDRNQTRRNQELPMLACHKVKVSFRDEKGEGNGVARSFYTAFCEAVLSNEKLAILDVPLFYQPGLRNFYSPRQGDATPDRLNAFRNVGRVIGICLSQSEICPIQLNRHVIKYILHRPISWHDLAFFDPILYESLRQLALDAENSLQDNKPSALLSLDLRFCVDLCPEEGGGQVELAPGGRNIEVTPTNVYEYVRCYSLRRMLKSQEKALQAIRQGIMDALPSNALDNLTAEDFRLLLNGVGEINVQTLISYTTFIDDRGTSAGKRTSVQVDEQLGYFKKWFWSTVEKMTTKERQDLVYFWTGSPSLPASEEGFQPMPTVSIRPAEDLHLPTSNVCIFRLYIPLYSSKAILRSKLLVAIKEKNFGFI